SARRVLLDELAELLDRFHRQSLVLLDRLHLVVVAHGEPELDEIGDLVLRKECQERLELLHRLVELPLAVERLADEETGPRRVGRVRVPLDDLPEILSRLVVPPVAQLRLAELVELLRRQNRRRGGLQPPAAARREQQARHENTQEWGRRSHQNWPIHIAHSVKKARPSRYPRPRLPE